LSNIKCSHQKLRDHFENDSTALPPYSPNFYEKWYHAKDRTRCPECNKSLQEMFLDEDDIDPTEKTSQQPHGGRTMYCNACQMYVKPTMWDGEKVCPYHQRVRQTEDGQEFMYEEFNQDGDEW